MELLGKKEIPKKEDTLIRQMLSTCFKVNHNQQITDMTIKIRREQGLKLPDAIIDASAQYIQVPLITADKGLAKIKGIDCILLEL
jgi:predicted nucleic acid-binding protein